jgi:16S rRNA (cytosine967-C5)-methyltransferase
MPRPLRQRDAELRCLLLAGLAQLDALQLSPHAAVGATAEAARVLGRAAQVGLVNALLRRALRETWPQGSEPGVQHSHPDWLVQALQRDWPGERSDPAREQRAGADVAVREPAPGDARGVPRAAAGAGIEALAPAHPPPRCAWRRRAARIAAGWGEGACWVQDGAAQLAVEALAPAPAQPCSMPAPRPAARPRSSPPRSAPAARCSRSTSTRAACAASPPRSRACTDGLRRSSCAPATPRSRGIAGERRFDAILIDAPCSATGIIRRQPDIKWHRRAEDVAALVALQARLLDALWPRLAPGGRLLYATCSLLPEENARQVEAFLARTPQARALPLDVRFGRDSGPGRQRLPGEDGMDGFFYALVGRDD